MIWAWARPQFQSEDSWNHGWCDGDTGGQWDHCWCAGDTGGRWGHWNDQHFQMAEVLETVVERTTLQKKPSFPTFQETSP